VYSGSSMKFSSFLQAGLILLACAGIGLQAGVASSSAGSKPAVASASIASASKVKPPLGYARAIVLWPEGAPGAVGKEGGDVPKLYVYPAAGESVHSAVIVLPGGGYRDLMTEKEGGAEARWLSARGVTAFVLQYRLGPRYRFPAPMLDGARAVRYVRGHAEEFGVSKDKIGLWGFSAGGHLAGYLATTHDKGDSHAVDMIERVGDRPDFVILSYGRLSMDASIPRRTSLEGLLGDHPSQDVLKEMSIDLLVTKETSPSFIYSTTEDQTVNSLGATAYYDALKRAGVPVEMHIFERGPHGTGIGLGLKNLPELGVSSVLVANWMQIHGWMTPPRTADKTAE
jgi:acetyl esterase/lipase